MVNRTQPTNRSEQEIAGYREALNTIHSDHAAMSLTRNVVLQMHRDLFQFVPGGGGRWKAADNDITEARADGTVVVRFKPLAPHLTPDAMTRLHDAHRTACDAGAVEPLLLIPAYVLDFLCIHPFADGNGRMARLLSLLLLYQAGYEVGRYISLESVIEGTKDGYYDALYASSQGWHEGQHTLIPWWEYFVGVMLVRAYGDFEARVGVTSAVRGAKRDMVRGRRHPSAKQLSLRRPRASPARSQPANDRPSASGAPQRGRHPMRSSRSRCDVGEDARMSPRRDGWDPVSPPCRYADDGTRRRAPEAGRA